jgi:hypothetical protein
MFPLPMTTSRAVGLSPSRRRVRRKRKRRTRWQKRVHSAWRWFHALPRPLRIGIVTATVLVFLAAGNFVYQVARKPTEMFFPVSGVLHKMPAETWAAYAPLFREHSTASVSPELLAALAQVEAAGNPLARTYWRWSFSWNPLSVYKPASSAVGMYQMTDAAFQDAREACVHDHVVVEDCWFTGLYTRVLPSHAIELAAVSLDRQGAAILRKYPHAKVNARQLQDLAALIHLCGGSVARAFARNGFELAAGQRCGDHSAAQYLASVNAMMRQFRRLAASE